MISEILGYDFGNQVRNSFRDLTSIIKSYLGNLPHISEGYDFRMITWSRLNILNFKIVVIKTIVRPWRVIVLAFLIYWTICKYKYIHLYDLLIIHLIILFAWTVFRYSSFDDEMKIKRMLSIVKFSNVCRKSNSGL